MKNVDISYNLSNCFIFLLLFSCGGSGKVKLAGIAPDANIPTSDYSVLNFEQEYTFLQNAIGQDLAILSHCGELQGRLYAVYWSLFSDQQGNIFDPSNDLNQKEDLMLESGVLEGEILDLAENCGGAYTRLLSKISTNLTQSGSSSLTEGPAILKFLTKLVTFSSEANEQLKKSFDKLSDSEKAEFFDSVVKSHAKYQEKTSVFGSSLSEFEQNLIVDKLKNEALALLKIANTGSVNPSESFSRVFWDDAQENKKLPIDLSLQVGAELIRDGADVLVDVATGSALGEFGKGVSKAKDIIEKVDKANSWLTQSWESLKSLYDNTVKSFFDGGKRSRDLQYTVQDYIDFEGNIAITENGAIQIKNFRNLEMNDLRAKIAFTNSSQFDSITLVHEFRDGSRSLQVITQAAGGTMPSWRYVPSKEIMTENATTIIASKRDPVTGEIKYTSTSVLISAGETLTLTLDVPDVTTSLPDSTAPGSSVDSDLLACQVTFTALNGQVCMDFSANGSNDAATAAKNLCDSYSELPDYSNASLKTSCASGAIKICPGSVFTTYFYHSNSSQTQNISCDASGQWVWGS